MDGELLGLVSGPVAVLALACAPGLEYERATSHGVAHFRRLGAEAYGLPDPREGMASDLFRGDGLVVLPGGSPARLLTGLRETGLDEQLRGYVAEGGAVMGASAGAMVLGSWTVLPEGRKPKLDVGLGLVADAVVVPHWSGAREDWLVVIDAGVEEGLVLGIPEESGVLLRDGAMTALGRHATQVIRSDVEVSVGHTIRLG
jgi:cyanophycinase-like exopeptidase